MKKKITTLLATVAFALGSLFAASALGSSGAEGEVLAHNCDPGDIGCA